MNAAHDCYRHKGTRASAVNASLNREFSATVLRKVDPDHHDLPIAMNLYLLRSEISIRLSR